MTHRRLLLDPSDVYGQTALSQIQMFSEFSDLFLSYEMGHLEPNTEVFEFALDKLGCTPSEVLVLDDKEKTVIAAKKSAQVEI